MTTRSAPTSYRPGAVRFARLKDFQAREKIAEFSEVIHRLLDESLDRHKVPMPEGEVKPKAAKPKRVRKTPPRKVNPNGNRPRMELPVGPPKVFPGSRLKKDVKARWKV